TAGRLAAGPPADDDRRCVVFTGGGAARGIGHDVDIVGGEASRLEPVGDILRHLRRAVPADDRRNVDDMLEHVVRGGALCRGQRGFGRRGEGRGGKRKQRCRENEAHLRPLLDFARTLGRRSGPSRPLAIRSSKSNLKTMIRLAIPALAATLFLATPAHAGEGDWATASDIGRGALVVTA